MINRSLAPKIKQVHQLNLPQPQLHHLTNGIPVYEIKLGSQDVIKLELIFKAGRWYETDKLVARATSQLLKAGTLKHNNEAIAEFFEYFGAKLSIYDGFNTVNVQLYCLSKHLEKILPMLEELISEPAFSEEELKKFIKRNQQNLKIQLQKNDVVAYRLFTEALFGSEHPYGYNSSDELYKNINPKLLKKHFQNNYIANKCTIILSGKPKADTLTLLDKHFGSMIVKNNTSSPQWSSDFKNQASKIHQVLSEDSWQASIRIGRRTFKRTHEDCDAFFMMNMVLGGFFGARLMQNLREKNGFTYGVYSSIETLLHSGYWYIHTDVGREVKDAALAEIYHEIERLQTELISQEELEMVRNYSLGMQLTALDGVFNIASIIKSFVTMNFTEQQFYNFINTIKTIEPEQIQAMAQKYLKKEDLFEVVIE